MSRVLIQFGSHGVFTQMLEQTGKRHVAYCWEYGADYYLGENTPTWTGTTPRAHNWRKVELLVELIEQYETLLWLDADSVIVRDDVDIFIAAGYGIACCECYNSPANLRHYNTGVLLVNRSPEVIALLTEWNRYQTGQPGGWEDQDIFIQLMRRPEYRDLLTILPNRFNCVETHMDATNPIIRSFHGDETRLANLTAVCGG